MSAGRRLVWGVATQVPLAAVVALIVLFPGTWVYVALFLGGPVLAFFLLTVLVAFAISGKWLRAAFVLLMPLGLLSGAGIVELGSFGSDWVYFRLRAGAFEARVARLQFRREPRLAVLDSTPIRLTGREVYRTILYYAPGQDAELSQDAVNAVVWRSFFFRGGPGNCVWNQQVRAMGNSYYIVRGFCPIPLST